MPWHERIAEEIAGIFEEHSRRYATVEAAMNRRLARKRRADARRSRAKYYRDKADPERWAAKLRMVAALRHRKLVVERDTRYCEANRKRARRHYSRVRRDPVRYHAYRQRRRAYERARVAKIRAAITIVTVPCLRCGVEVRQVPGTRGPRPTMCSRRCRANARMAAYRARKIAARRIAA